VAKARAKTRNAKVRPKTRKVAAKPRRVTPKAAPARVASSTEPKLPAYDALPVRPGAPKGSAWGLFGDNDEVGTINLLTPERVRAAAVFIRTGKVFPLNLPIDIPDPPLFKRGRHVHKVIQYPGAEAFVLDDSIDNFNPQASSQWDALAHVKHIMFGAYNGIPDSEMTGRGGTRLGIDNLARRGIAGRGVLADLARYYERHGKTIEYTQNQAVPLEDLEATLKEQRTRLRTGDILLIRFGWTKFYINASEEIKAELARETLVPGLEASERVARWIWDNHLGAVAADSPALEPLPPVGG